MNQSTVCLQPADVQSFLENDMTPDELAATEGHLSSCASCRQSIEENIGPRQWWDEVQESLRAGTDGRPMPPDEECNESTCPPLLELLGPTDDPDMLGRIGPYEVVGILGRGGMGAVFKAFDPALNRFVAIKVLLPYLAASGAARKRFLREAQAAAAVVDDHVMAIHGVSEWQGHPYFVMPYARGVSLQRRLTDDGPLELREVLRIGLQTARALAAAHAQGIVHRDVKPANIFLEEGVERVQLMDFGLARAIDDASLTRTGTLAGTPHYMSPEQARAEAVDTRADLFSLGAVLYAASTGHAPFRAETSYAVLRLITDHQPRPIREINPDIPDWLCAVIAKLMSKRPADRFESAEAVAQLLEDCLAHVQQPSAVPLPWRTLPACDSATRQAASLPHERNSWASAQRLMRSPYFKLIAAAAFTVLLVFAGILIVLETGKGTLTLESEADNVPIRITQGDTVVERLTVSKSGESVRVAAGKYVVQIEGETDDIRIANDTVSIERAGQAIVRIVQQNASAPKLDTKSLSDIARWHHGLRLDTRQCTDCHEGVDFHAGLGLGAQLTINKCTDCHTRFEFFGEGAPNKEIDAPPSTGTALADAIHKFNQGQQQDPVGKNEPPLTEDEVIAAIRAASLDPIPPEHFVTFEKMAEAGRWPPGWRLESQQSIKLAAGGEVDVWSVSLIGPKDIAWFAPAPTYPIRQRAVKYWPGAPERKLDDPTEERVSLRDLADEFNKRLAESDPRPAPLTVDEVVAAMRLHLERQPNSPPDAVAQEWATIATTRTVADGSKLELQTEYQAGGFKFTVEGCLLRIPASEADGASYALPIRKRYLAAMKTLQSPEQSKADQNDSASFIPQVISEKSQPPLMNEIRGPRIPKLQVEEKWKLGLITAPAGLEPHLTKAGQMWFRSQAASVASMLTSADVKLFFENDRFGESFTGDPAVRYVVLHRAPRKGLTVRDVLFSPTQTWFDPELKSSQDALLAPTPTALAQWTGGIAPTVAQQGADGAQSLIEEADLDLPPKKDAWTADDYYDFFRMFIGQQEVESDGCS